MTKSTPLLLLNVILEILLANLGMRYKHNFQTRWVIKMKEENKVL